MTNRKFSIFLVLFVVLVNGQIVHALASTAQSVLEVNRVVRNNNITTADEEITFSVREAKNLFLKNPHGNIIVLGRDGDQMRVQTKITVYATEDKLAEDYLKNFRLFGEVRNETILIELGVSPSLSPGILDVKVDYTIYLPKYLNIQIEGKGMVKADDIHGTVKIINQTGSTYLSKIKNNIILDHQWVTTVMDSVEGNVEINSKFGDLSIKNVRGNLKIRAEHAKVGMVGINGEVGVNSSFGSITGEKIEGNVTGDLRHCPISLIEVIGHVTLKSLFANVKLQNVQRDIDIIVNHGDIEVRSALNHRIFAKAIMGKISAKEKTLKVTEEGNRAELIGQLGGGKYQLKLETRSGSIYLE